MKIRIRTREIKLSLWFPNNLIFSRLGLIIGFQIAKRYVDISKINQQAVLRLLKQFRRYRGLRLVEIESKSGEQIVITL
ncbi:MAG: hypothetical protein ACOX60_05620 [Massiliimalia sp.]|jgi:hypothetical protein